MLKLVLAKRDTAINAYNDRNWIKVISLYEELEESNFHSHKLLIAASNSYRELSTHVNEPPVFHLGSIVQFIFTLILPKIAHPVE